MSKCLLMTLILYYFRIYFIPYDQIRWETNSLYLEVQISLNLCIFESCISLPPSFPSFLVFPGRVMGFPLSVKIILCKFHNTSDLSFFFLLLFQGDSDSLEVFFIFLLPMSDYGLQHARLPCPSPSPGACSNSCP